ncbi:MAG: hypothetical protein RLZZ288_414, partial [Planctomycetota bacterium]
MSDRKAPRWPILLLILVAAGGVVMSAIYGPGAKKNGGLDPEPTTKQAAPATDGAPAAATPQPATATPATTPAVPQPTAALGELKARVPQGSAQMMQFPAIGSLDPSQQPYQVEFAKTAAGIE